MWQEDLCIALESDLQLEPHVSDLFLFNLLSVILVFIRLWLYCPDRFIFSWLLCSYSFPYADVTLSNTCSPSSSLPDPLLLLHSLSFPNLTWVVQGFDVDLPDPEASPTHFLQRYLEALSMSGDRTLDSLFGRQVQCVAVRTPADLNAIREEMGGEGLGNPNVDLFHRLHPEFVADVARIRERVERGLTAKGKGFTGKVLGK